LGVVFLVILVLPQPKSKFSKNRPNLSTGPVVDLILPEQIPLKELTTFTENPAKLTPEQSKNIFSFLRTEASQQAKKMSEEKSTFYHFKKTPDLLIRIKNPQGQPINFSNSSVAKAAEDDLTFSWESPDPWDAATRQPLESWLTQGYPVLKSKMGSPYLGQNINIAYDANLGYQIAGYYSPTLNLIVISPAGLQDKGGLPTLFHELTHAFTDDAWVDSTNYAQIPVWEEGTATLMENEMVKFFQLEPGAMATNLYDYFNRSQSILSMGNGEYIFGGAAFQKIYLEHPNFFLQFTPKFYQYKKSHLNVDVPEKIAVDLAGQAVAQVEGRSFFDWYHGQYIFHPQFEGNIASLYLLDDGFLAVQAAKFTFPNHQDLPNGTLHLKVFNEQSQTIFDQNIVLEEGLFITTDIYDYLNQEKNAGRIHRGRFKATLSGNIDGLYSAESFAPVDNSSEFLNHAIYGFVNSDKDGQVTLKNLSWPLGSPIVLETQQGAFFSDSQPNLWQGPIEVTFQSTDGKETIKRLINKDQRYDIEDELGMLMIGLYNDPGLTNFTNYNFQSSSFGVVANLSTNNQVSVQVYTYQNEESQSKSARHFGNDQSLTLASPAGLNYFYLVAVDLAGNVSKSLTMLISPNGGQINLNVTNQSHQSIPFIASCYLNDNQLAQKIYSANGSFSFTKLPAGDYRLVIQSVDYQDQIFNNLILDPGGTINKTILMAPKDPLQITKQADHQTATAGELIVYKITAENITDQEIAPVHLIDQLPGNCQYLPGTTLYNGHLLEDNPGQISPMIAGLDLPKLLPHEKIIIKYSVITKNP
jgi:uncharacterized repeat protein (TIGR01451 family)